MVGDNAPRGVVQEPVQIRLPVDTIEKIDELVKQGKYSTRSDFIKQLIIRELNSGNAFLLEKMDEPEVREKIQEICKEVFASIFTK